MIKPRSIPSTPILASALAALLAAFCAIFPAAAQTAREAQEQAAFRAAVERVAPSVVQIETIGGLERMGKVLFGTGPTTGLIVEADGHIVSSAFGFANQPTSILVRLPEGTRRPATLVATDHNRKLVLLKIEVDKPLPVPAFAPLDQMRVGQWAIAVGRAFDHQRPNMAVGILSAFSRIWGKAIQTDAAVSPNNYGGPLVDICGRVLGVLVPMSPESDEELSGVEWYDSGIGFAIDGQHIRKILPRWKQGDLRPGLVGLGFTSKSLQTGEPVVGGCRPNSPAAKAGLQKGDRIVEVEGRRIERAAEVKEEISRRYAGDTVALVVLRGDKRLGATMELAAELQPLRHAFLGVLPMRQPEARPGVRVRYVYPDSPAAKAGIQPGDRLRAFQKQPITDRQQLRSLVGGLQPGETAELQFEHNGRIRTRKVTLAALPEGLPPADLPAAYDASRDGAPAVKSGAVPLKVPEWPNEAMAYVPKHNPAVGCGVVVWLQPPGPFDWDALLARWQPLCDAAGLILVAPKPADPNRWSPQEAVFVRKLLDLVDATYSVDSARVVVHGHEGGGTLASLVALKNPDAVAALAAVEAPLLGRPPENESDRRLAIYLAWAEKSPRASGLKTWVDRLRKMAIPATTKRLGPEPRALDDAELAELVRWIDMLDRI